MRRGGRFLGAKVAGSSTAAATQGAPGCSAGAGDRRAVQCCRAPACGGDVGDRPPTGGGADDCGAGEAFVGCRARAGEVRSGRAVSRSASTPVWVGPRGCTPGLVMHRSGLWCVARRGCDASCVVGGRSGCRGSRSGVLAPAGSGDRLQAGRGAAPKPVDGGSRRGGRRPRLRPGSAFVYSLSPRARLRRRQLACCGAGPWAVPGGCDTVEEVHGDRARGAGMGRRRPPGRSGVDRPTSPQPGDRFGW